MTAREKRHMSRILVERITKATTLILIIIELIILEYVGLAGLYRGIIITMTWFLFPDVLAYYLENKYHIKHKHDCYR